jgi:6-phospho-beta-glucosidase
MRAKKLCVIGGGGVRSPFVARTIARAATELNIGEVVFFDINAEKLGLYGVLAQEIARRIAPELVFTLSTDERRALSNCDYVITSIRVGEDASRVADEALISAHGLLAQETTGAGGFSMAMRSIPALTHYCELAREVAHPDHLILNFTNPAGLVTQALLDQGFPAVGICDTPLGLMRELAQLLGVARDRFWCNSFGLNHLSWFSDFRVDGVDVSELVIHHPRLFEATEMRVFEPDILAIADGHLLNEYLYFYYYNKRAVDRFATSAPTRAQLISDVNFRMSAALRELDVSTHFDEALRIFFEWTSIRVNSYFQNESGTKRVAVEEFPSADEFILGQDSGGYAGVAVDLIRGFTGVGVTDMVLSTRNQGAIKGLGDGDVVEVMCRVADGRIEPHAQNDIPTSIMNLVSTVKEYERLSVRAILHQDRSAAVKALTVHPLVGNFDIATTLVRDLIEQNAPSPGAWT